MNLNVIRASEYTRMPWSNGGGVTAEVIRSPRGQNSTVFTWRVSIADVVADGDFSAMPGIDRIIVLVEGEQMHLSVDGIDHPLRPRMPFAFSGDARVFCSVPAPTRDLNVMTARGRAHATVEVIHGPTGGCVDDDGADELVLVCLDESALVSLRPGESAHLEQLDTAVMSPARPVTISGSGSVAVVRIHLLDLER